MSIASEITRLQGVKADILTAISDKGVTVPSGSALDDCPGLIDSISATNYKVIGGREYRTVLMPDGKEWLAENLDLKFCNIGGAGNTTSANAWYYDNDEGTYGWNGYKCGLLYNWYAVKLLNDNRADLCPGWHVATKNETDALAIACGGSAGTSNIGNKLKALDNSVTPSWPSGWNGTNDYGFSVLPAGFRDGSNYSFANIGTRTDLWTSDEYNSSRAYSYTISADGAMRTGGNDDKKYGFAVRLVRDT